MGWAGECCICVPGGQGCHICKPHEWISIDHPTYIEIKYVGPTIKQVCGFSHDQHLPEELFEI